MKCPFCQTLLKKRTSNSWWLLCQHSQCKYSDFTNGIELGVNISGDWIVPIIGTRFLASNSTLRPHIIIARRHTLSDFYPKLPPDAIITPKIPLDTDNIINTIIEMTNIYNRHIKLKAFL